MRKSEKERLMKLYMTEVEAAMNKRTLAYNMLGEAEFDLATAKRKLRRALGKEDEDGSREKD